MIKTPLNRDSSSYLYFFEDILKSFLIHLEMANIYNLQTTDLEYGGQKTPKLIHSQWCMLAKSLTLSKIVLLNLFLFWMHTKPVHMFTRSQKHSGIPEAMRKPGWEAATAALPQAGLSLQRSLWTNTSLSAPGTGNPVSLKSLFQCLIAHTHFNI